MAVDVPQVCIKSKVREPISFPLTTGQTQVCICLPADYDEDRWEQFQMLCDFMPTDRYTCANKFFDGLGKWQKNPENARADSGKRLPGTGGPKSYSRSDQNNSGTKLKPSVLRSVCYRRDELKEQGMQSWKSGSPVEGAVPLYQITTYTHRRQARLNTQHLTDQIFMDDSFNSEQ
ncbi:hypothetical protein ScPMuIL_001356 [Solemya velum]